MNISAHKQPRLESGRSLFRSLPLSLARRVSVFLVSHNISKVEELIELLGVYPLIYISVDLAVPETTQQLENFSRFVADGASIVLDVLLHEPRGDFILPIVKLLLRSKFVEALTLRKSHASPKEVKAISEFSVESINKCHLFQFSFDRTDDPEQEGRDAKAAAELVANDKKLCCLCIKNSGLKLPCARLKECGLLEALRTTNSLCYLGLGDAGIDAEGAILLAEVLQVNRTIEYLSIGANPFADKGVLALAESLLKITTLRTLKIPQVEATERGGMAIANALMGNNSLRQLHLKDDSLGPECGRAFAQMLKVNSSLRFLCLDFCELQAEGCKHFILALSVNRTLEVLRLNFNGITREDQVELTRKAKEGGVLKGLEVADRNLLASDTRQGNPKRVARNVMLWNKSYASHLISRYDT